MSENHIKITLIGIVVAGAAALIIWGAVYTAKNCERWDYYLSERTDCRMLEGGRMSCRTYQEKNWYCAEWKKEGDE